MNSFIEFNDNNNNKKEEKFFIEEKTWFDDLDDESICLCEYVCDLLERDDIYINKQNEKIKNKMNENSDLYMWKNIIMIVAHLKNTMLLNHAPKQKKKHQVIIITLNNASITFVSPLTNTHTLYNKVNDTCC